MIGCTKDDTPVEESTTSAMEEPAPATTEPMGTDMGTTEPMGTDMGTTEPMGTDVTPPPAG